MTWLLALAAAMASPPPPYLSPDEVLAALNAALPALQACADAAPGAPDAALPLQFTVAGDGRFVEVALSGAEEDPRGACWRAALEATSARPHREDPVVARAAVVVHEGRVIRYPAIGWDGRDRGLLGLYTPPGTPPEGQAALRAVLGVRPIPIPQGAGPTDEEVEAPESAADDVPGGGSKPEQ